MGPDHLVQRALAGAQRLGNLAPRPASSNESGGEEGLPDLLNCVGVGQTVFYSWWGAAPLSRSAALSFVVQYPLRSHSITQLHRSLSALP
jgi:hypothetical protein